MAAVGIVSDEEVLRAAAEVLARPEYAWRNRDDASWLELFERIQHWFLEFMGWMDGLSATAPVLFWTILLGLVLLSVALLAHVVVSVRAALRAPGPDEARPPDPTRRDRVAEAEALARGGRFLDGARQIHLACLEILIGHEVLHLGRGDAGRAVREALADAPLGETDRVAFAGLLDQLERAVFRDGRNERDLYDIWLDFHRRLAVRWGES